MKKEFNEEQINSSGIFYFDEKRKKYIDRFKNRIIFPVKSLNGSVLALGGRTLFKTNFAKYINSPETDFFKKDLKVLHFAPEAAFLEKFKKLKNISYDTIDLNSPLANIKADICDLPLDDESYDFILCNHVLEHIEDDRSAMSEIYRVLKKDGIGILQVPIDNNLEKTYEDSTIVSKKDRTKHFGQYDHVRVYGRDFKDRLKNIGFIVNFINYTDEIENNLGKRAKRKYSK